jgi:hypothetical protein
VLMCARTAADDDVVTIRAHGAFLSIPAGFLGGRSSSPTCSKRSVAPMRDWCSVRLLQE